ncbi:MAG: hypothetical protein PWP23_1456 [Candidatus Sumerlaeota bacterium]|nr:hypothetical protein [Candidatus Sumerlaeota bacterium]
MSLNHAKRRRLAAVALLATGLATMGLARIDLVTLPATDRTELTIYGAEDLTLVRETRTLMFAKGENSIQFNWTNTLIDPTSVQLRAVDPASGLTVLDTKYPGESPQTAIWTVEAEKDTSAPVEIRYFTSGVAWKARFNAIANEDETALRIEPSFTLSNNSGRDIEQAESRLLDGEVRVVEAIAMLARKWFWSPPPQNRYRYTEAVDLTSYFARDGDAQTLFFEGSFAYDPTNGTVSQGDVWRVKNGHDKAKEIVQQAVSEYYLYSIEGEEDLRDGWSKALPRPAFEDVPIDVSYEYNPAKYGSRIVKFYKFANDEEHELGGAPLAGGAWQIASADGRGGLRYEGSFAGKYYPLGEDIELELADDGLVQHEEKTMSLERRDFDFNAEGDIAGYVTIEKRRIEIRNSRTRAVPFKITRNYGNEDWSITEASKEFKQVDRNTVEWELDVPASGTATIDLTLETRMGTRSTRNPGAPIPRPIRKPFTGARQ